MKSTTTHILSVIASIVLLAGTLLVPSTINTKDELRSVHLGLPMSFVVQDLSAYDTELPASRSFGSLWENPTQVAWGGLAVSFVFFLVLCEILIRKRG